jgi:hypothetical protein
MSVESSAPRSRRAVLAAALGGLGAVVVSRFVTPEAVKAADGDAVLVGQPVSGTAATTLTSAGTATGLAGHSASGTGLWGASDSTAAVADWTASGNQTGVLGVAGDGTGIANNTGESGVYGFSNLSIDSSGVWGDSQQGSGVFGTGTTGVFAIGYWGVYARGRMAVVGDASSAETGVYGFAGDLTAPLPPAGVGVQASAGSTAQIALNVSGKAKFSRSGRTLVAAGRAGRKVTMAGVTTSSYIIATLQSKRTGIYVQSVVPAAGYFTIYLNKAVSSRTAVGFLVIN